MSVLFCAAIRLLIIDRHLIFLFKKKLWRMHLTQKEFYKPNWHFWHRKLCSLSETRIFSIFLPVYNVGAFLHNTTYCKLKIRYVDIWIIGKSAKSSGEVSSTLVINFQFVLISALRRSDALSMRVFFERHCIKPCFLE